MLRIENLNKKFGNFTAVDNLNLKVNPGELFGFLGPNGAGKTTTIKMISGLLSPSGGKILLDDLDIWKYPIDSKQKIGYIPDQPFLYDKLTGLEYLRFCGGLFQVSRNTLESKIEEMISRLKIGSWINKRTEEYSQGMRQRIVIASAFLHSPRLLLVDEPMVGLDPQSAFLVKNLLKEEASNGKIIFMSTHSLNVVEEICTHVAIINNGKLIFNNIIAELNSLKSRHEANLEKLFIELTNEDETSSTHP